MARALPQPSGRKIFKSPAVVSSLGLRTQVIKRIVLGVVAVAAMAIGSVFASSAEAHGPYCGCRQYTNYGYGGGYGGVGYGGMGYGGVGYGGYGAYGGYAPYAAYRSPVVPYGAGYSGGWQPYQG